MTRKQLSKKIRFEIFKRDEFKCQYCGNSPPKVILHVDHINPVKLGGVNDSDNLITSCIDCNLGKSAIPLSSIPLSLQDKAVQVKEKQAQIKAYNKILQSEGERLDEEAWKIVDILFPNTSHAKKSWFTSIRKFLGDLDLYEVMDAAEIASDKYFPYREARFSYFCGMCWNRIKEAQNG